MMINRIKLFFLLGALFVSVNGIAGDKEIIAKYSVSIDQQIDFVRNLLDKSSISKRVKESDNQDAKQLYIESKELHEKAINYNKQGKIEHAAEALFYSTEKMFRAARLAKSDVGSSEKEKQQYDQLMQSVDALMIALQRISAEKGQVAEADEIKRIAVARIENSKILMENGQPYSAKKELNKVYVEIKTSISKLRSGETLINSLRFKSKKDEYLYELDRNDTHHMLVSLLLVEKVENASKKKKAQTFINEAAQLRERCEVKAREGDYDSAISACEKSTSLLIKAIRNSGFFIPGS